MKSDLKRSAGEFFKDNLSIGTFRKQNQNHLRRTKSIKAVSLGFRPLHSNHLPNCSVFLQLLLMS